MLAIQRDVGRALGYTNRKCMDRTRSGSTRRIPAERVERGADRCAAGDQAWSEGDREFWQLWVAGEVAILGENSRLSCEGAAFPECALPCAFSPPLR